MSAGGDPFSDEDEDGYNHHYEDDYEPVAPSPFQPLSRPIPFAKPQLEEDFEVEEEEEIEGNVQRNFDYGPSDGDSPPPIARSPGVKRALWSSPPRESTSSNKKAGEKKPLTGLGLSLNNSRGGGQLYSEDQDDLEGIVTSEEDEVAARKGAGNKRKSTKADQVNQSIPTTKPIFSGSLVLTRAPFFFSALVFLEGPQEAWKDR